MSAMARSRRRAKGGDKAGGALDPFDTRTNTPENAVAVFARKAHGTIVQRETVRTGARVSSPGSGRFLHRGERRVDKPDAGGRLLSVVNAGQDTISSFRVSGPG